MLFLFSWLILIHSYHLVRSCHIYYRYLSSNLFGCFSIHCKFKWNIHNGGVHIWNMIVGINVQISMVQMMSFQNDKKAQKRHTSKPRKSNVYILPQQQAGIRSKQVLQHIKKYYTVRVITYITSLATWGFSSFSKPIHYTQI